MAGIRSSAEAKDFSFSFCVHTGAEVHPASYPMGTVGPFPRVKRGRGVTLTTHPRLVPRSRMSRSYISSPPWLLHGVAGQLYFHCTTIILHHHHHHHLFSETSKIWTFFSHILIVSLIVSCSLHAAPLVLLSFDLLCIKCLFPGPPLVVW
jgi:hypothetical protein